MRRAGAAAGGALRPRLLGGLARTDGANPHDVRHRLAEKTGAEAYVLPVPLLASSAEDREVRQAQRRLHEALAARAEPLVVGIGTAGPGAQLVAARMIAREEIAEVRAVGGVGEMLGHFFNAAGRPVESRLSARTVSPPPCPTATRPAPTAPRPSRCRDPSLQPRGAPPLRPRRFGRGAAADPASVALSYTEFAAEAGALSFRSPAGPAVTLRPKLVANAAGP